MRDFLDVLKGMVVIALMTGLVLLIVPAAVVFLSGGLWPGDGTGFEGVNFANKVDVPQKIDVWLDEEKKSVTVDFEDYVACVTASEMPASFHEEAIKAQSVAARTYAMAKVQKFGNGGPDEHPKAPVCNTVHCQVYRNEEELIAAHSPDWAQDGWAKVRKACQSTEGQLLYYDGTLVTQPLFFSSSGGQTENSEDVFVSAVPYLISVSSPYEEEATHQNEEKIFTIKEFRNKMKKAFPEENFGNADEGNIKVISRTAGGRVDKMQIGDVTLRGTQVRSALGLSSSLFSISFREGSGWNGNSASRKQIVFTSSGSGHGVGMSQYGANGMAKEGKSYKEILRHYYSGTEIY